MILFESLRELQMVRYRHWRKRKRWCDLQSTLNL